MATPSEGIKRIVVGLDGSDHAAAALDWAISLGAAMKKAFEEEWCKPLRESGLGYRMEM